MIALAMLLSVGAPLRTHGNARAHAHAHGLSRGSAVVASQRLVSLKRRTIAAPLKSDSTVFVLEQLALKWATTNQRFEGKKLLLEPSYLVAYKSDSEAPPRTESELAALAKSVGIVVAGSTERRLCDEERKCRAIPAGEALIAMAFPNIEEGKASLVLKGYWSGPENQVGYVMGFSLVDGKWKISGVTGFID